MAIDPNTPQPPPTGDGEIVLEWLIKVLRDRAEFGRQKYGTYLRANNGRDTLRDLFEELVDATMYCAQLIMERDGE